MVMEQTKRLMERGTFDLKSLLSVNVLALPTLQIRTQLCLLAIEEINQQPIERFTGTGLLEEEGLEV